MRNSMQIKVYEQGNCYCLYDELAIAQFSPDMLKAQYWQNTNAVTGSAQGRGTTWFVQHNNHHWVLRHYYRGGLIGKLVKDSYLFTSLKNTRAAQEFALLAHMQTLSLPVPKPVAYRIVRRGFLYRADILSSRIENAQDLVAILSKQALTTDIWKKIGVTIKQFHDNNIYHHDLNAHNILINEQQEVFLIDFDRGELREADSSGWQQSNIARLLRSFTKELNKLKNFNWSEENWQMLLKGYKQVSS